MSSRKKSDDRKQNDAVIVICVQEPFEDGSSMNFGTLKEEDIRFLHQAFITDSITHALALDHADVRLYYKDKPERVRLVRIVTDYLAKKLNGKIALSYQNRFAAIAQADERWGIRIETAFQECFAAGYSHVLLVGSRTPTITSHMMENALAMLKESDAVFGPTPDGRYYCIGIAGSDQVKLSDFDWKSPKIYSDVASAFSEKHLAWSELPIWYAVETPEDLEFMARDINQYRFEGDDHTARETELVMERILAKLQ